MTDIPVVFLYAAFRRIMLRNSEFIIKIIQISTLFKSPVRVQCRCYPIDKRIIFKDKKPKTHCFNVLSRKESFAALGGGGSELKGYFHQYFSTF